MDKKEPAPQQRYYAVVLDSAGDFTTESFATAAQLTARLKELIDQDVSVSCFFGHHMPVSRPPFRHVQLPDGSWAPLFEIALDKLEPDSSGYLGLDPIGLQAPAQIKISKTAETSDDEFFDDQPEDVLGAFDEILPDPDS